jgi:hypothetical protein
MALFGDSEAAVCDILRAALDVAVSPDLVGFEPGTRWVRVTRTGGVPTLWMQLDNPTIQLDIYAETKAAAHDLATAARAAVFAGRATYSGRGLAVFDVGDLTGLSWMAEEPAVAHYTFTLALVMRPTT